MSTEAADFAIGWVDCGEVGDHSTRAAGPQEPAGRRAASDQIEFKVQQKQRLPIPKLGFPGATNTDFYLVGATVWLILPFEFSVVLGPNRMDYDTS